MAVSFYTSRSGIFFVSPGGQSEPGKMAYDAGYRWACVNIADGHPFSDWTGTVNGCIAAGMRVPVWGRVQNTSLEHILGEAIRLRRPCILNIEDEFKTTSPAEYERRIKAMKAANPTYTREICISTVGWLYNDVDYRPLRNRPFLLQIFPQDMRRDPADLPQITNDCISHARTNIVTVNGQPVNLTGIRQIGVTFQTYGQAQPEWYAFWTKSRSIYTGDQVGALSAWQRWSVP